MASPYDVGNDKTFHEAGLANTLSALDSGERGHSNRWARRLLTWGVESRGIQPVPPEERTDTQYNKIFFICLSANTNILSFSAGTLGPVVFGLGLRDTCLVIVFFNMLCCLLPAYLFYGVIIPCIVNLVVMIGFMVLSSILGGQALASVNGQLSWTVGIVIVDVIALLVSFCGYKVLSWYERIAWIPVVISFIVALAVGGKHLSNAHIAEPATASAVLSFASTLAGFATLQCLGGAVGAVATTVPAWDAGYAGGNVGGLLEAMLQPVGGFGKFLTVLLSLSVAGNMAATFYSITLNIQVVIPPLVIVPRYVFSIFATAVYVGRITLRSDCHLTVALPSSIVPLAIVGSTRFYDTLTNFLGLIGYWASSYAAIILAEHLYFRKCDANMYDVKHWNDPRRLPSGIAAVATGLLSFGLIIPSMEQVWFVGPIAKTTGDIGFEVAFGIKHSHEQFLISVRKSLSLSNPDNIVDPVFGLLGNAAATTGAGKIAYYDVVNGFMNPRQDPTCLQQATADQAFTNAKVVGDIQDQVNALTFRALERNSLSVGATTDKCTSIKAVNLEIAAISQHQDPASPSAVAVNKAIVLELARQIHIVGGDPLDALKAGMLAYYHWRCPNPSSCPYR
ncbi:hypothetical protein DXG03_002354 [Asterophora parasitica]|uniref:Uncharacterized protein n=1 Tax=Asterophora parasitica TaxID=117018 RepID=A0A9P7G8H2_9AGAR|nr:hypothetical protein DXG03_002354 [Asterophora parasitica]